MSCLYTEFAVLGAGGPLRGCRAWERLPLSESEGGHVPHPSGETGDMSCHLKPGLPTTFRGPSPHIGAAGVSAQPGDRLVNVSVPGGTGGGGGVGVCGLLGSCAHVRGVSQNPLCLAQLSRTCLVYAGLALGAGTGHLGAGGNPLLYPLNREQKCYGRYPRFRETFGDRSGQYFSQYRAWDVSSPGNIHDRVNLSPRLRRRAGGQW